MLSISGAQSAANVWLGQKADTQVNELSQVKCGLVVDQGKQKINGS